MKKLILACLMPIALVLLISPVAHAQTPCGQQVATGATTSTVVPSNYTNFYNPSPNYNTVTLPVGPPGYQDTDFSTTNPCTVIRVTKGDSPTPVMHVHAYKYTPISCTDDLELIGTPGIENWNLYNIPSGTLFAKIPSSATTGITNDNNTQPVWAHCTAGNNAVSGRTLYWHDAGGTKIYAYRADLGTSTVIHDFSNDTVACGGSGCVQVCWGCSSNGPHDGMAAPDDTIQVTALSSNGHWYGFVYDLRNAEIWPGFTPVQATTSYPLAASTPSHRLLMDAAGSGGFNLYDATGTLVRNIANSDVQHNEEGLDANGNEVIYELSNNTPYTSGVCTHPAGIIKFTVDPPLTITCVADTGWEDVHLSITQSGTWLAVSTENDDAEPQTIGCTNNYYNTTNSSLDWSKYFTFGAMTAQPSEYPAELLLVKTDGSVTYRLAHHRTREYDNATCTGSVDGEAYDYWASPRAAVSYDGTYVAFSSNFGFGYATLPSGSESGDYTDEYLVATSLGGNNTSTTAPAPPSGLTAIVQ